MRRARRMRGRTALRAAVQATGAAAAAALVAAASACGPLGTAGSGDDRPRVAVTVAPQAWPVERLAGDRVRVDVLIPPGASPHTFEPTLETLRALHEAALVVRVGHPGFAFEAAWLAPALTERPEVRVVDWSAGLADPGDDPHVWLSPRRMEVVARRLEAALGELLPDHAAALSHARRALERDITALDAELRAGFEARRPARRFFVMHPAWGHFAGDYGLVQVAIEAEGKEPDARRLAALMDEARRAGVRILFVQPQVDPRPAELLAREIGARVEVLDPLARDWLANLRHAGARIAQALVP